MPTEGDDDRLLLARQHRRSWLRRSCPDVRNRATALPLANSLLVDAVALCERSQALLTMLYRSTDRLRRRGASMKNLAHSASFHSTEKIAPSKAGIKHLAISKRTFNTVALSSTCLRDYSSDSRRSTRPRRQNSTD